MEKKNPTQMANFHMSKLHNWSHIRRHALTLSSLLCKAERIFGLTMRTTSKEEKKGLTLAHLKLGTCSVSQLCSTHHCTVKPSNSG